MRRPWGRRKRAELECPGLPHRRAGQGGERGAPSAARVSLHPPDSDAYLPGRREAPAAFAPAKRVTALQGKRAAPGSQRFPTQLLRIWLTEQRDWVSEFQLCPRATGMWDALSRDPCKADCNPSLSASRQFFPQLQPAPARGAYLFRRG